MNVNPASPQMARAINDRMALDLLVEHGKLSAPQLRELTGLSRPTVSDLLERLQDNDLITVVGEAGKKRRGPNAKLYGIVGDLAHVAGVDLRDGVVDVAVADLTGDTIATARRTLSENHSLAGLIRRAVGDACRRGEIEVSSLHTVVVGAPGFIDQVTGELLPGYHFPGWDAQLLPGLVDALNVPIALENEVHLAGVAELHHGAGRGRQDLAVLWLDRSVGASIILDGRLRQGASGGAGEVGKLALPGAPLPVPRRAAGGLHTLVSTSAVRDLAAEYGLTAAPIPQLVSQAVSATDAPQQRFADELAARIAMGVLGLVAVVDPGLVVLAGDVGLAGDEAVAGLVAGKLATLDATPTQVSPSTLTEQPIVSGAVLTALGIAHDDIFGGSREMLALQDSGT
jgi:predicted NBD/HSP70 family sugar kinase